MTTTPLLIAVTGTDTAVGKTTIARGLLRSLLQRGLRPFALKWVETGCEGGIATDGTALAIAANLQSELDRVAPIRLLKPAAPTVAARAEQRPLLLNELQQALHNASQSTDLLIVEGAGGALVPMTTELTFADLCVQSKIKHVVVVARTTLGTINHTALTIEALRSRNMTVLALVLNSQSNDESESVDELRRLFGSLVLGPTAHCANATDDQLALDVAAIGLTDRVMSAAAEWAQNHKRQSP